MPRPEFSELHDIQGQPDFRRIPLDRVGVRRLRYPLQVLDRRRGTQNTVATIALTADLPHHYRGTHMSRFIEALNAHGPVLHVDNIRGLLESVRSRLGATKAHAEIGFPFFIEKQAPVTGATGLMDYDVRFAAELTGETMDFCLTVFVPVTTLCPCSKAISDHGAHNQRGLVTFAVRSIRPMWVEDLIHLVERCASSELFSILKRPDEKAVTERAYRHPVFVEDLVREIAARAALEPNIVWYRVEAENFESIHNHNAYAAVEHGTARPL